MAVSATTSTVSFTGNGSTTEFAVTFAFQGTGTTAEIEVVERVIATGAETVKSNPSNFTVTGGNGSTGTVIAASAPADTVQWHIRRTTTRTQTTDYIANDPFPAETHELALDRLAMSQQEIQEELDRTFKVSRTNAITTPEFVDNASTRANKILGFSSDGNTLDATISKTDLTTAATKADEAAASATAAAASATASASSASAATTNGAAQVSLATTQATNAAASATAAAASAAAANVTVASQAEAEAGTDNSNVMTALRTKQAVDSYGVIASTDVATSGANKILKLDGSGHLPALNGSNLTNLPVTDVSVDVRFLALQVASDRIGLEDGIADPYSDETDIDNSASANETHVSATSHFIGQSTSTEAPNGSGDWTGKTGSFTLTNDDISGGADGAVFWSDQLLTGDFSVSFTSAANPGFGMIGVFAASEVGTFDSTDGGDGDLGDMTDSFFILRSSSTSRAHCGSTDEAAASEFGSVVWKFERSGGTIKVVRDGSVHHTYTTRTTTADMRLAFASIGGHSISFQTISASIPVAANLTLQSNAFTADAAPATVVIGVQVVENEAITVNTDLTAEVSRNGGSNFTTCTLALKSTLGATSTKYYESASTDISGQPSGTSMKYRVKTLNDKDIEVHGVTVKWSE